MAVVGWMRAWKEVVVDRHAGQSHDLGLGRMSEDV